MEKARTCYLRAWLLISPEMKSFINGRDPAVDQRLNFFYIPFLKLMCHEMYFCKILIGIIKVNSHGVYFPKIGTLEQMLQKSD